MTTTKQRPVSATGVRIPQELHQKLKDAADDRDLSVNFMIVKAIEDLLDNLIPTEELRITRPRS